MSVYGQLFACPVAGIHTSNYASEVLDSQRPVLYAILAQERAAS